LPYSLSLPPLLFLCSSGTRATASPRRPPSPYTPLLSLAFLYCLGSEAPGRRPRRAALQVVYSLSLPPPPLLLSLSFSPSLSLSPSFSRSLLHSFSRSLSLVFSLPLFLSSHTLSFSLSTVRTLGRRPGGAVGGLRRAARRPRPAAQGRPGAQGTCRPEARDVPPQDEGRAAPRRGTCRPETRDVPPRDEGRAAPSRRRAVPRSVKCHPRRDGSPRKCMARCVERVRVC
jgi:hypothetical protein